MVVEALGLDAVDLGRGRQRLERQADPGHQPAARGRAQQHVGARPHRLELACSLQPRRALAGDDEGIVVGGHQHRAALVGDALRDRLAIFGLAVVEHHLGAQRPGGLDLDGRRVGRHHDHRRAAHHTGRRRHALGVVAGREGHHACLALLRVEPAQAVVGAAEFERAGPLQHLGLDEHPPADRGVQGVGAHQRRLHGVALQAGAGVLHIGEGRDHGLDLARRRRSRPDPSQVAHGWRWRAWEVRAHR